MTQMKYGMRNVMPPQMETMMGKRQMLPNPTALPAVTSTALSRPPNVAR